MKGRPTPLVEMLLTTATSHSRFQLQVERSALCGLVGGVPYSGRNSWDKHSWRVSGIVVMMIYKTCHLGNTLECYSYLIYRGNRQYIPCTLVLGYVSVHQCVNNHSTPPPFLRATYNGMSSKLVSMINEFHNMILSGTIEVLTSELFHFIISLVIPCFLSHPKDLNLWHQTPSPCVSWVGWSMGTRVGTTCLKYQLWCTQLN